MAARFLLRVVPGAASASLPDFVPAETVETIRVRRDFLSANRGKRYVTPAFILLVQDRSDGIDTRRQGITVTKKVGNAVVRNRIKRRFRALGREVLASKGIKGADHVMIGRREALTRDFALMRADLEKGLAHIARALT
ncbi:MAG: ribonuclease P protein component [Parasphingorhabdus sp.]|nr:ribonuclease P protein component [Parasphingorhabdus sp.]